jgi:hypothetical protein
MDELVERLSSGNHPVAIGGANPSPEELRHGLEETRYVLIKFTGTKGGTELGTQVDSSATDPWPADFQQGSGFVHIEGTLILNDDPVRVITDIDLTTLRGTGRLKAGELPRRLPGGRRSTGAPVQSNTPAAGRRARPSSAEGVMVKPASTSSAVSPDQVHEVLGRHVLTDGFPFVYDVTASHGSWLVDARTGEEYLDLYTFFASAPLGSNPPELAGDPDFRLLLAEVAVNKPANPDMYTTHYAEFVETFARVLGDPALPHLFFIEGGALAVENALKAAFDWKSRRNEAAGRPASLGAQVLHLTRIHAVAHQHRSRQDRTVPQIRLAAD